MLLPLCIRAQSSDDTVQKLPSLAITATPLQDDDSPRVDQTRSDLVLPPDESLAEALDDVPAITFARRGANNVEPVIRGFSFDRISTLYNGLPLLNASPTRTAAPINYFRSGLVGQVTVHRSLPSVTAGPVTTGGQLVISSFPANAGSPRNGSSVSVRSFGNQNGIATGGSLVGQTEHVSYRLSAQYAQLGDYTAGDGRTVDADHESWGESAALRLAVTDDHSLEFAVHHYRTALDRNISLPFDTVDSDFYAATLNHTWQHDDHTLHFRAGYTKTYPYLSTSARLSTTTTDPTPPTTTPPPAPGGPPPGGGAPPPAPPPARPVNTDFQGHALAYATGFSWQTSWSPNLSTTFGADATWATRDVPRERLLSDNSINIDRLWPDVLTRDLGLFGELTWQRAANRIRFGARLDRVHREARAADSSIVGIPGARGDTIRQNYVAFNGPDAGETTRNHTTGATNLTFERDLSSALTARLGLGLTRMAPRPPRPTAPSSATPAVSPTSAIPTSIPKPNRKSKSACATPPTTCASPPKSFTPGSTITSRAAASSLLPPRSSASATPTPHSTAAKPPSPGPPQPSPAGASPPSVPPCAAKISPPISIKPASLPGTPPSPPAISTPTANAFTGSR